MHQCSKMITQIKAYLFIFFYKSNFYKFRYSLRKFALIIKSRAKLYW